MGLSMNVKKTKLMIISRNKIPYAEAKILVDGNTIERVQKFKYLGSWLNENWDPEVEIKYRIVLARTAFVKYQKVLCNRQLNINLRLRYLRCYIWSTVLYGAEAWTLKTTSINKLEAFEMWCYRRILKIPWTDKVSNIEVLDRLGKEREIYLTIKKRKTAYLGHIMRNEKYELLQII